MKAFFAGKVWARFNRDWEDMGMPKFPHKEIEIQQAVGRDWFPPYGFWGE